ncbi:SDR family NAD(P)-dependent oxidoreductase [Maritimibacter fusiformis]|uniref:SDR family oxidoreductase n=1 Tax=Maritimibacter fusiformis TaxID=2603819 RepID=A0A5D0RRJ2_9RHOB|nr:SDR family oxidoreductase [Maritimibacter fusiformis]TYB83204.1 SDR family oxidoreductase [Maritimibacter fusiformis]
MITLTGKAIVITGAGDGLGAAYARHAASLGAAVLVNDIVGPDAERVADEITAAGGRAVALPCDISRPGAGRDLVAACRDAFGTITGFVNNAGILRPGKIEAMWPADLRRMFEVNLFGTAQCTQAAVAAFREQGSGGAIVNVASGSQAGDIGLGAYAATKGGIASLTYSWAMELRDTPIRVNAISPLAETAMARTNAALLAEQSASRDVAYTTLPTPETNAPLVSYLLSDAAQGITGQLVRIAGRDLSLVTHPMIAAPVLTGDWDVDAIARAFDETLRDAQPRLGLTYAEPPVTK